MIQKIHPKGDDLQGQKTKIVILFLCFFVSLFFNASKVLASEITEAKLVELTNQERTMRGLKPFVIDYSLYFAAKTKAKDMIDKDYFEHYSPDGKTPWMFINNSGYKYTSAGENLAMDFRTSEGIHKAWMNSPTHKENIIDSDFEDIGLAVLKGDFSGHETIMVVEMFGKKRQNINPFTNLISKITQFLVGF